MNDTPDRAPDPPRARRTQAPKRSRASKSRPLIETRGPKPDSTLSDVRLTIGRIAGTHGVTGELKLKLITDTPEHLRTIEEVYLGDATEPTRLLGIRMQHDQALIRLDGVTTPEAGKRLGGLNVRIAGTDARPLEDDEYFIFQLIGLRAIQPDGTPVGTITDIMETGTHDVLVIRPTAGGDDLLVPNHPEFVKDIAPEEGRIVLIPPVYPS